ncbi:hypothetical protein MZP06_24950, partial [Escherichia coli]
MLYAIVISTILCP